MKECTKGERGRETMSRGVMEREEEREEGGSHARPVFLGKSKY